MIFNQSFSEELVGQEIEVLEAENKKNLNRKGLVVDETKNTLKMEENGKIRTLLKSQITFRIRKTNQVIRGVDLLKKPEERIKS